MNSAGIFIGVMLLILSTGASDFSNELKMLGFKKESSDLFRFAMFLSLVGFLIFIVAYPRIPYSYPSVVTPLF